LQRHELARMGLQYIPFGCEAVVNLDIAPLDPAKLAQSLFEIRDTKGRARVALREPDHDPDDTHAVSLLGVRPVWPGSKRAAQQRQNVSTSHGVASP
jgi:hypothetical protein